MAHFPSVPSTLTPLPGLRGLAPLVFGFARLAFDSLALSALFSQSVSESDGRTDSRVDRSSSKDATLLYLRSPLKKKRKEKGKRERKASSARRVRLKLSARRFDFDEKPNRVEA